LASNLDKPNLPSEDPIFRQQLLESSRRIVRDMRLPESAAEDIYQSTLTILSGLSKERIEQIGNLAAYASKMARNVAIEFQQKTKHREFQSNEDLEGYSDQFEDARRIEFRILLRDIWAQLDTEERELLRLIIFGYKPKQISRRFEISHDSARQKISRLRKKLRELIFEITP